MPPRNVLILHTGALGDFIQCWPLVLTLGRLHAQSRIIVVTHASKGALAERALRVESADIENGWQKLFVEDGAPTGPAEKLAGSAHAIYSFLAGENDVATRNLRRWAPQADVVALTPRPPEATSAHVSEFLLNQLGDHPAVKLGLEQMLRAINERGLGVPTTGERILVHPGSGSEKKNWPVDRFVELIARLKREGHDVATILGEVERERWSARRIGALTSATEVLEPATYLELFDLLRQARMLIANDNGPAHLAGIMGMATLVLFGPSDPRVWKPLGPRVQVIHDESLESLSADEVRAAAMAMLK